MSNDVTAGGTEILLSGATDIYNADNLNGGVLIVSSGGTGNAYVNSGGTEIVSSGGRAEWQRRHGRRHRDPAERGI